MGGCEGNVRISLSSIILFLFNLFQSHNCYSIYNITATQSLSLGQTLFSPSQEFELGFFIPNNSGNQYVGIWYKEISPRKPVWVANRENPVTVLDPPASLIISSDGNLELVDGKQRSIWSTNISGVTSASASNSNITTVVVLSDNGNLILKYGLSGEPLWQSFHYPGDTFLPPNTALGFNAKTGERHVLTCWANNSDPSPGKFVAEIAPQRPPEAVTWKLDSSSTPYWRSGPWDGLKFIGIPDMDSDFQHMFRLEEDIEKGTAYFSFNTYNSSTANLVISPEGVLQLIFKEEGEDWYVGWEAPNSTCDNYGVCGPFAVCKNDGNLICECLKGFVPKSKEEWSKKIWTGGCERRTNLSSCGKSLRGNRDGFWKMDGIKLPHLYEFVQLDQDAENCHIWCLNNCSCLAYAYVNNIGCLVWSKSLVDIQQFSSGGQQLCLRLAHSELVGDNKTRKIIYGVVVVSVVTICGAILVFIFHKRTANERGNMKDAKEHLDSMGTVNTSRDTLHCVDENDPSDLPLLDFDSISIATNFFNPANKLGQGGFGPVYKGKLQDGRDIAVKRLSSSSGQGIEEFKNEIILISKLRHRNLVRLIGYCIDREERLLIYEFLQNKSLDTFLFDELRRAELTWERRFNIIQGIARGLLYLHRDSNLRVIHRDLKVSNILLDEKMNPKISDFGLARMFQGTLELASTHRLVGTLGYMSPEYAMAGKFSVKSDVFSFGVLLLEIVSGRKNTSFHDCDQPISLVAYAWQLWSECRGLDLMDKVLADSFSPSEVLRCIHVGLLCVQDLAMDRPTTPDLVSMLISETVRPQPKQPVFTFQSSLQCDLQTQRDNVCSLNEASITVLQGR